MEINCKIYRHKNAIYHVSFHFYCEFLASTAASFYTVNLTGFFYTEQSSDLLSPLSVFISPDELQQEWQKKRSHFLEPDPELLSGSVREVCCFQIMGTQNPTAREQQSEPRKSNFHFHSVPVGSIKAAGLLIFLMQIYICQSFNAYDGRVLQEQTLTISSEPHLF